MKRAPTPFHEENTAGSQDSPQEGQASQALIHLRRGINEYGEVESLFPEEKKNQEDRDRLDDIFEQFIYSEEDISPPHEQEEGGISEEIQSHEEVGPQSP